MQEKSKTDYKPFTDEQLILQFQNEDKGAYVEIVMRYKDRLVNFLYRFTGNRETAEDISQETFLKLYKNKDKYSEIAKFSTWLYTIALNEARSNFRKEKKHSAVSINDFYEDSHNDYQIRSDDYNPEEDANAETESFYIQKAINSLNEIHREIIVLRDIEELDYEEIAKTLDIPLGTVRSRINRARESLKVSLDSIYRAKSKNK
ncbi:MAG: sigma-70 family RNA polymerase sigma factor [Ignavibacteria bacterium]|jgi:RNA polymerase sigma-70 factor (ECF subfamily)|nr:sigma-70 family RNA polymerase sigma factor [Ignavibacteria bacterium]MBK7157921.1 sigma-70 family RNA polymerase sigma factor [Ignavibacteria bacterium]MBK7253945.1 sigma-70 family RNA polymerase sigma factor [Ignavibacteria bacterium]MBK9403976.1 sigma-70 family RNA polymerase sigma factor [Ignavibacteria bacterium]